MKIDDVVRDQLRAQLATTRRSVAEVEALVNRSASAPSTRGGSDYSLAAHIQRIANLGPRAADARDTLEGRLSAAARKSTPHDLVNSMGFHVPIETHERGLTVGSASGGGYLVETDRAGIIDHFYPRLNLVALGITLLPGQRTNGVIPRVAAGSSAYWIGEGAAIPESTPTLGVVAIEPKTVGCYVEYSRQFFQQANADAILARDIGSGLAAAVEAAALNGSGALGEPLGLLNTSGVGSAPGSSMAWSAVTDMEADVALANSIVDERAVGYVGAPGVRKTLKDRERFAGAGPIWDGDRMNGRLAVASNVCPASTLICGDWSQMILASWGTLAIDVDVFTGFKSGRIGVRGLYAVDVAVRAPGAFSVATGVS